MNTRVLKERKVQKGLFSSFGLDVFAPENSTCFLQSPSCVALPLISDSGHPLKHNPDAQISNLVCFTLAVTHSNLSLLHCQTDTHAHVRMHEPLSPCVVRFHLHVSVWSRNGTLPGCPWGKVWLVHFPADNLSVERW